MPRARQKGSIPPTPRHKEPPKELDSASSDEEDEDGDFTVYECPGLAPVSAPGWGLTSSSGSFLRRAPPPRRAARPSPRLA